MEEMKDCFGRFLQIPACTRCKYHESCRIYSLPEPQFRLGFVSGDSINWEAAFFYVDQEIPEEIYFDDPPSIEEAVGPEQVLQFLRHLDSLNAYSLCILREVIYRVMSVSELAARHGVTRQAMNEKLITLSSRAPWTVPFLMLCRRRMDKANLKMLKLLRKTHEN